MTQKTVFTTHNLMLCVQEKRRSMSKQPLRWDKGFEAFDMYAYDTPRDGNCLIHAAFQAFYEPYFTGILNKKRVTRTELVRAVRQELANKIGQRVDILNPNSPTYYEQLGKKELANLGKTYPEFSLENMKQKLQFGIAIGEELIEFISDNLERNIYILDNVTHDAYVMSGDLTYKVDRDSIVVLYTYDPLARDDGSAGHYETVGINTAGTMTTHFEYKNPFISFIRARIRTLQTTPRPREIVYQLA